MSDYSWFGRDIASDIIKLINRSNDAEAKVQYNSAWDKLQRGAMDFQSQLSTDPNIEGYTDKWNKAKDQIWKSVTSGVTNKDALDALQESWDQYDVKAYGDIKNQQVKARTDRMVMTAEDTIKSIMGDDKRSTQDRKQGVRNALQPLVNLGLVKDPSGYLAGTDNVIDSNAMQTGLTQIARTEGWDYSLSLIDNPKFSDFFPSLTQEDRDNIRGKLEGQRRLEESSQRVQDDKVNEGVESKIDEALSKRDYNSARSILNSSLRGRNGGFQGEGAGKLWESWEAAITSRENAELSLEKRLTPETASLVSAQVNDIALNTNLTRAGKIKALSDLAGEYGVGKKILDQWDKLASLSENNKPYFDLRQSIFDLSKGKSPSLTPTLASEAVESLDKIFENDRGATIDKLTQELQPILDQKNKKMAQQIVQQLASQADLSQQVIETQGGGGQTLSEGMREERKTEGTQRNPRQIAEAKGIKISSVRPNGDINGTDGMLYRVRSNGNVVVWQDGSWQTIK